MARNIVSKTICPNSRTNTKDKIAHNAIALSIALTRSPSRVTLAKAITPVTTIMTTRKPTIIISGVSVCSPIQCNLIVGNSPNSIHPRYPATAYKNTTTPHPNIGAKNDLKVNCLSKNKNNHTTSTPKIISCCNNVATPNKTPDRKACSCTTTDWEVRCMRNNTNSINKTTNCPVHDMCTCGKVPTSKRYKNAGKPDMVRITPPLCSNNTTNSELMIATDSVIIKSHNPSSTRRKSGIHMATTPTIARIVVGNCHRVIWDKKCFVVLEGCSTYSDINPFLRSRCLGSGFLPLNS